MKKIFYLLFIGGVMANCTNKNPYITFKNDSSRIDSLKIFVSKDCPPLIFNNIEKEESKKGEIIFCDNAKGDGSYEVQIFSKGKLLKKSGFGYYTNGASLNSSFKIVFTKDQNIIVEEN